MRRASRNVPSALATASHTPPSALKARDLPSPDRVAKRTSAAWVNSVKCAWPWSRTSRTSRPRVATMPSPTTALSVVSIPLTPASVCRTPAAFRSIVRSFLSTSSDTSGCDVVDAGGSCSTVAQPAVTSTIVMNVRHMVPTLLSTRYFFASTFMFEL
jgi:hypothetical protein